MPKVCLVMLLAFSSCAFAQDSIPLFRATAELVLVDVQLDRTSTTPGQSGAPITSLHQGDFELFEDNVLQEIKVVSRDRLPLSIVLLVDLTDTVRPVLNRLAAGAKASLSHLRPDDEVAVMAYSASAHIVGGFTKDRERTSAAIERAAGEKSREAAFFNEAIYQASEQLRQSANPSSRRVVIWLTDNLYSVPSERTQAYSARRGKIARPEHLHTEQEALRSIFESGTVVSVLLEKSSFAPLSAIHRAAEARDIPRYPPGDAYMYTERTGGQAIKLGGKNVQDRLGELIDEMRSRYTIGYTPAAAKPPGTFCALRVTLARDAPIRPAEWTLRTMAGYYRK